MVSFNVQSDGRYTIHPLESRVVPEVELSRSLVSFHSGSDECLGFWRADPNPRLMSLGDRCHLLEKTGGSSGPARLCVLGAGAKTEPGQDVVFFLDGLSWSLAFFRVP